MPDMHVMNDELIPRLCLQTRPQEAAFVLSLLHPDPDCRPSVDAIVRSELLLALHKSIRQRKHSSGAPLCFSYFFYFVCSSDYGASTAAQNAELRRMFA